MQRKDEEIDPYDNMLSEFTPNPNTISSKSFVYDEHIRDFFWDSSIEQLIEYPHEKLYLYQEMSLMFGPTSQLDKCMDKFLKKLFEDVYKISSEGKTYVVYTFTTEISK